MAETSPSFGSRGRSHGFTLVELLTVIAIIGILVSLSVPAVFSRRESARASYCQNNLRQLGIGMNSYASRKNAFCSGAFDWVYDGAVTDVGWVADQVAQGTQVGLLLCPSNSLKISETYYDLLGSRVGANPLNVCNVVYAGNAPTPQPNGLIGFSEPCNQIADPTNPAHQAKSAARQSLVLNGVLAESYNTNYTASWILVRSGPILDASGNATPATGCANNTRQVAYLDRNSTIGPLKTAMFDGGGVPSNTIPLLGCGGPAVLNPPGPGQAAFSTSPQSFKTLPMALGSNPQGALLAASFTGGPMENPTSNLATNTNNRYLMKEPKFPNGTPYNGANGWWNSWAGGWVAPTAGETPPPNSNLMPPLIQQDYRQFSPVHRGYCNIVFADGSVRTFQDADNDQQLNDGFPGKYPPGASGFVDHTVEIGPSDVFSSGTMQGL